MKKNFIMSLIVLLCVVNIRTIPVIAGTVYLNNIPLGVDIDTVTKDGYVFVPLRKIADMVGAKLGWDDKTKTITVYDPFSIESRVLTKLTVDKKAAVVYPVDEKGKQLDAVEVEMDAAPVIIDSQTYISLDFILGNLGYSAEFDKTTGDVYLSD